MIIVGDNDHFGGIVHSPFSDDTIGQQTVKNTAENIIETLESLNTNKI